MKKNKITSIAIAVATVAGISLISSSAQAQGWRNAWGWGQPISQGGCNTSTLRNDVYTIDRIANQMVCQFSREMNYRCSCSVQLLNHLKDNARLTRNLVTALNGSCKCTFKKAACTVNDQMTCVARQSQRVRNLSCSMKSNINESVILARQIHRNADQFVPRNSYSNHRSNPSPSPYSRHRGNNHNTRQQDPLASLIFSILNR